MARESIDIALGRGGDQAAVKTVDGFEFYGGISHGVEKRSHVRSRIIANALVRPHQKERQRASSWATA